MAGELSTFGLYFLAGSLGACLYLLLLLMTDRDVQILRNNIVGKLWQMTILYVIAGGAFAAIVQLSSGGGFKVESLQAVLLLGFGWQGALSGVGASNKVESMKKSLDEYVKTVTDNAKTLSDRKDKEIEEIKAALQKVATQGVS